jgi:asparagine synthase (glutamine-hydrolysing)
MCGIAGYVAAGQVPNPALLREMCDRLRHRGPDGSGYFYSGQTALGHRRLSIIDVSGGAQPLGNEDGSVVVSFNGEIYNYLDLREDLLRRSHVFTTSSDTEVLVHLYEEVGERLPEYLNGMFAFAIWDARRQELFLARDRFGKKPLYYSTAIPGAVLRVGAEGLCRHRVVCTRGRGSQRLQFPRSRVRARPGYDLSRCLEAPSGFDSHTRHRGTARAPVLVAGVR